MGSRQGTCESERAGGGTDGRFWFLIRLDLPAEDFLARNCPGLPVVRNRLSAVRFRTLDSVSEQRVAQEQVGLSLAINILRAGFPAAELHYILPAVRCQLAQELP
jgi:hypothetical protein